MTAADAGYTRHAVVVPSGANRARVWRLVGALPGMVALNVVNEAGQAVLLADETIAAHLEAGATIIAVEAMPEERYRQLVAGKIAQALDEGTTLRTAWRTQSIGTTTADVQILLRRLTEIALLVSIFGRQRHHGALVRDADTIVMLAAQLTTSAFQFDDTVRATDDMQYELRPVLVALHRRFSSLHP